MIAGAYELAGFAPDLPQPSPVEVKAMAEAYRRLPYDLVCLAPEEKRLLDAAGEKPAANWITAGEQAQVREMDVGGVRVGIILFPALPQGASGPPGVSVKAIRDKAGRLRERADVVIGVSPWGATAEQAFLDKAAGSLDVLLGSGPGPGFPARVADDARTVWMRPTSKGHSVDVLRLGKLPREGGRRWAEGELVTVLHQPLDEKFPEDPGLLELFKSFKLAPPPAPTAPPAAN
jgi:hypothetical protein